jgi:hypothetical protein
VSRQLAVLRLGREYVVHFLKKLFGRCSIAFGNHDAYLAQAIYGEAKYQACRLVLEEYRDLGCLQLGFENLSQIPALTGTDAH